MWILVRKPVLAVSFPDIFIFYLLFYFYCFLLSVAQSRVTHYKQLSACQSRIVGGLSRNEPYD